MCGGICVQIFPFYKDISNSGLGPTELKRPNLQIRSHFKVWGVGLQDIIFGGHNSIHNIPFLHSVFWGTELSFMEASTRSLRSPSVESQQGILGGSRET